MMPPERQPSRWPRGKTLGGSSATNGPFRYTLCRATHTADPTGLYLIHASQSEHDGWATLVGNDSWSGARMAAGIRKSERWTAMSTQDAADLTFAQDASAHGVAGP
jgi:choline dehydrogenase-like flavoprotein